MKQVVLMDAWGCEDACASHGVGARGSEPHLPNIDAVQHGWSWPWATSLFCFFLHLENTVFIQKLLKCLHSEGCEGVACPQLG